MTTKKHRNRRRHHHRHRYHKKSKTIKKDKCSPKKGEDALPFTCYTSSALNKIKNVWNERHPDEKIKSTKPREIWEQLRLHMSDTCNSESCWLRHQCIKHDIDRNLLGDMFAPVSPEKWKINPNEWLTTVDIQKVMKQWEKANPTFRFLGPSPINYDTHIMYNECVWEDICKFDLVETIKKGIKNVGIIFNLDKHTEPGSHWVAIYIDINKEEIYYFDSYGDKIPSQLLKFCETIKEQSGGKFNIFVSKKVHQRGNSECGMYCLYFIIQLLNGTEYQTFQKERVPDEKMEKLRKEYFNSHR